MFFFYWELIQFGRSLDLDSRGCQFESGTPNQLGEKMYKVRIKTKYNIIELTVDDVNSPEMKEIFNQPYIEEVYIETTEHYKEKLIEERDKALSHVVGTSYYNELAHKKNNEIKKLLRKE